VFAVAVAGASCALGVAACGSSGHSNSGASSGGRNSGLEFADCMRSHGVPNFPDPPSGGGGGIQINANSGINPNSPAFQSARTKCMKLLPGGGPLHGPVSESRKLQMLSLSRCMRAHGVPDFPDPTSSPPAPGNGLGIAFGGQGSFIAVTATMMQSPAFQQAAAACGFPGAGRGGGPKPASPPG
jgi:hypothetical protein